MGVASSQSTSGGKLTSCYNLVRGQEGFAVLIGSEQEGFTAGLSSMDSALNKTCRLVTQVPFLSATNAKTTPFSGENFDKLCHHFLGEQMLDFLAQYSSYFFYFCGHGNDIGMLTSDDKCIPYATITKNILTNSSTTQKPTVLVFDCHYSEHTTIEIESVVDSLSKQLDTKISNALICFTFTSSSDQTLNGTFTTELAHVIRQYSHLLPFTDLIDMAGSRAQVVTGGIIQGPVCVDHLTAQLVLVEDPAVKIFQEPEGWFDYCCTQIKRNSGEPSPPSDMTTPGTGHTVLLLYADDACGPRPSPEKPRPPPNEVYALARSLSSLGFEVICDCMGRRTSEKDWVRWYSGCLSMCTNVILVCSPLMGAMFSHITSGPSSISSGPSSISSGPSSAPSGPSSAVSSGPLSAPLDPSTISLDHLSISPDPGSLCAEVITHVFNRMKTASSKAVLEVFPVLVSTHYNLGNVPTAFAREKAYYIDRPQLATPFDHTLVANDYHALVFDMCRLPHPQDEVTKLPASTTRKDSSSINVSCSMMSQQSFPSFNSLEDIINYFYKPVKQGYKVVTQVQPPQPVPSFHQLPEYQQYYPSNPHPGYSIPSQQQYPHSQNPIPSHPNPYSSINPHAAPPVSVRRQPVNTQALLWLTGKVVQWKFLGRRLGLEESVLYKIEYDNPRDLSEQCYQMLMKWLNDCREEEGTYGVLFDAVRFAESEKMMKDFEQFATNTCLNKEMN